MLPFCSGAFLCTCHAAGVGKQAEGELHGSSPETIPFLAELMEGKNIKQMGTHIFVNKLHHFT